MSEQTTKQPVPRLKTRYKEEIVPALVKEFNYSSVMQVPRVTKIAVNIGMGEALQNSKAAPAQNHRVAVIGKSLNDLV